ncbi:MAG: hypothetical protein Fur0010_11560 [Bdellovibrio sp.]
MRIILASLIALSLTVSCAHHRKCGCGDKSQCDVKSKDCGGQQCDMKKKEENKEEKKQ